MCIHTTSFIKTKKENKKGKTKKEVHIYRKKSRIFGIKIYRESLLSFLFSELFTINEHLFNHERSHILKEITGKTLNMVIVTMGDVGET